MPANYTTRVRYFAVGASVTRTFTAASAATAVLDADESGVYDLCANQDCFIKIGAATPTAAAGTSYFLPAHTIIRVAIAPNHMIAAIREDTDGTLYINPVGA
jgi:hypothetical protein